MTAIATTSLFLSAHAVHASANARAPALEMTVTSRVSGVSRASETSPPPFDDCTAKGEVVNRMVRSTESPSRDAGVRICLLLPQGRHCGTCRPGPALWTRRVYKPYS